jgi:transposase
LFRSELGWSIGSIKCSTRPGVNCQQWKVDILGFSGKRILQALCAGESDPMRLAKLMHPAVNATEAQVVAALTADMREHHRFLLRERAFPD